MTPSYFDISVDDQFIDWNKLASFIQNAGGGHIYPVPQDSEEVYPDNDNELCQLILNQPLGKKRCVADHHRHLLEIKESLEPTLFQCHAGFWNLAVPLQLDHQFFGAIMGCGILDHSRQSIDYASLASAIEVQKEFLLSAVRRVPLLTREKIEAFQSLLSLLMQNLVNAKISNDQRDRKIRSFEKVLLLYNTLYKIYKEMRTTLDFDLLLDGLVKIINDDTKSDAVFIYLLDEKNELILNGTTDDFKDYIGKVTLDVNILEDYLANYEYSKISGHPLPKKEEKRENVNNIEEFQAFSSEILVPMISNNIVIGCLELKNYQKNAYDFRDKQFMTFIATIASQCAIALENALLRRKTELLSVTDEMTTLFNFRFFSQKLNEEITRCARYGHTLSLIMLDLDRFKDFNDTFGHPAGDLALHELADIMKKSIRDVDIAARYGGEEFSIILPETGSQEAQIITERIRKKVASHNFVPRNHQHFRKLTISAGIASFPHDAAQAADLIDRADKALYYSKTRGRNRVSFYHDLSQAEKSDAVRMTKNLNEA
ncbi:diguanylate cyclase [candidate division CSSED10-310 bacterium]|uniref:Diguanylate cyclase n=1 Tax=candidate division CSSED10-310 bacterium TaxID=2855610 RepID=A0ABV6YSS9_UNCC1